MNQYSRIAVADFDKAAAIVFLRLKSLKLSIGTNDLKIAAIAIANNATLLTRNTKDFGKIPGLLLEDWPV